MFQLKGMYYLVWVRQSHKIWMKQFLIAFFVGYKSWRDMNIFARHGIWWSWGNHTLTRAGKQSNQTVLTLLEHMHTHRHTQTNLTLLNMWYPVHPSPSIYSLHSVSPPSILCRLSVFWSGVSIFNKSLCGPPMISLKPPPPILPTHPLKSEQLAAIKHGSRRSAHSTSRRIGTVRSCFACMHLGCHGGNQYVCTGVSRNKFLVNDDTFETSSHCYYPVTHGVHFHGRLGHNSLRYQM